MELTVKELLFALLDLLVEADATDVMDFAPQLTEERIYDIFEVRDRWEDEYKDVWIRHYENGETTD